MWILVGYVGKLNTVCILLQGSLCLQPFKWVSGLTEWNFHTLSLFLSSFASLILCSPHPHPHLSPPPLFLSCFLPFFLFFFVKGKRAIHYDVLFCKFKFRFVQQINRPSTSSSSGDVENFYVNTLHKCVGLPIRYLYFLNSAGLSRNRWTTWETLL